MAGWIMVLIAALVVALPVVLMLVFNRDDVADSRGRRIFHRWHT